MSLISWFTEGIKGGSIYLKELFGEPLLCGLTYGHLFMFCWGIFIGIFIHIILNPIKDP